MCSQADYALKRGPKKGTGSLTRLGPRLVCGECSELCEGCGFRYVDNANRPHACLTMAGLPYGLASPERGWGSFTAPLPSGQLFDQLIAQAPDDADGKTEASSL